MNDTLESRIRERAYEIWDAAGCPEGQAQQHWLAAEREVLAMAMAEPSPSPPAARRPSRGSVPVATSKSKRRAVG